MLPVSVFLRLLYGKRTPAVLFALFRNSEAMLFERGNHILRTLRDDTGGKQNTVILQICTDIGSHTDDNIRNDIGTDQIVFPARKIYLLQKV